MALSTLAQRLLNVHATTPNGLFYADEVLGSLFRESDLKLLDQAYEELARAGLMQEAGVTISYFGSPKNLYRITEDGRKEAKPTAA